MRDQAPHGTEETLNPSVILLLPVECFLFLHLDWSLAIGFRYLVHKDKRKRGSHKRIIRSESCFLFCNCGALWGEGACLIWVGLTVLLHGGPVIHQGCLNVWPFAGLECERYGCPTPQALVWAIRFASLVVRLRSPPCLRPWGLPSTLSLRTKCRPEGSLSKGGIFNLTFCPVHIPPQGRGDFVDLGSLGGKVRRPESYARKPSGQEPFRVNLFPSTLRSRDRRAGWTLVAVLLKVRTGTSPVPT